MIFHHKKLDFFFNHRFIFLDTPPEQGFDDKDKETKDDKQPDIEPVVDGIKGVQKAKRKDLGDKAGKETLPTELDWDKFDSLKELDAHMKKEKMNATQGRENMIKYFPKIVERSEKVFKEETLVKNLKFSLEIKDTSFFNFFTDFLKKFAASNPSGTATDEIAIMIPLLVTICDEIDKEIPKTLGQKYDYSSLIFSKIFLKLENGKINFSFKTTDGKTADIKDFDFLEHGKKESASMIENYKKNPGLLAKFMAKKEKEAKPTTQDDEETPETINDKETPAGKVHKTYFEKTEEIKEEDAEKDRATLRDNDIKTIRFKSRLLKPKAENEDEMTQALSIKEETAKRIKAYTEKGTGDWYTLDYQRLGSDKKGHTHEMNVGLGDILLDPSIKDLLVKKADGSTIKAHRGIVPTRQMHAGRLAFLDENNRYLDTYTGDSFRILSNEEADLQNPESLKKYLSEFSEEEKAREENEKNYDDEIRAQEDQDVYYTDANLDPSKDVVDQIKIPLNSSQKENARIIEDIFKEKLQGKGLSDEAIAKIIAAAIVNAYKESGLDANSIGDRGNSIGLFQLNINGAGHGMSVEERQDPTTNTTTIIEREVLGSFGRVLIARAKAGATVTELAAVFSKYIERPRDVYGAMQARSQAALKMFGERVVNTQDEITERIDNGKEGYNGKGILKLRSNQDAWIFGSSSAVGLNGAKDKLGLQNVGFFGIVGINSENFYKKLVENWDRIKALKFPPQVILMGMAANGLNNLDSSVRENLENYSKIKALLESRGTKVTVTTVQPSENNGEGVSKFNDELRKTYGENCIDVAKYTTTPDGKTIIPEYAAQYGHLKGEGAKIMDRMVVKAVKDGEKTANESPAQTNEAISEKIKNGIINLHSNQDSWILGSSSAVQMNGLKDTLSLGNTGFFGIGGSGPDGFYKKLQENWPRISQLKLPKQIVIAGLAVNGLTSATNSVEKNLAAYERIRKFLSEKGVKVKIATIQPAVGKGEVTREFNDELRKKYDSDVLIDISKYTVSEDGTKLKPEYANSDGIHLSKKGYKAFAKMIKESANGNT